MFIHTQSFEDLTADSEEAADRDGQTESTSELSHDISQLSTQEGDQSGEGLDAEPRQEGKPSRRVDEDDVTSETWRQRRKHVFVLSEAGKPIYSRYGTEEALSSTMGVMVALVCFVEAEKNVIKSIHAGESGANFV